MKGLTKRDLCLFLHSAGRTVNEISRALECQPADIERCISEAGGTPYTQEQLEADIEANRRKYATR